MKYYWVRIFDYKSKDEDSTASNDVWGSYKGIMLDEYYLSGENLSRDEAKEQIKLRSNVSRFAKPRKGDDIYAVVLDSNQFFYDRFYKTVDTVCLYCNNPIKGMWASYPKMTVRDVEYCFCNYDCRHRYLDSINPDVDGEWQEREGYDTNGGTFGYIYHIYNRHVDKHYIGQTKYMPFFRWQEHVKDGIKGDITDLTFDVITEVKYSDKGMINDIEAWWIQKFIDDYGQDHVMNIAKPVLHEQHYIDAFNRKMANRPIK